MKKFINDVENVENEMLEGIVDAHPEYVKRIPDFDVLVRAERKLEKLPSSVVVAAAMNRLMVVLLAREC